MTDVKNVLPKIKLNSNARSMKNKNNFDAQLKCVHGAHAHQTYTSDFQKIIQKKLIMRCAIAWRENKSKNIPRHLCVEKAKQNVTMETGRKKKKT